MNGDRFVIMTIVWYEFGYVWKVGMNRDSLV